METFKKSLPALFIALGLIVMGWFIYAGISRMALKDRQVAVRGLAERSVLADKVTWPLVVKLVGNDLKTIYGDVSASMKTLKDFLLSRGINEDELSICAPSVFDKFAQQYNSNDTPYRYYVTAVLTVTSSQVEKVNALVREQAEFIRLGVPLSNDYQYQTVYEYTSLNEIKPEMIEEATRNARAAAVKFAEDSGSRLGKIKSASQGQFSITNRDDYTPWIKNVRVVTSIVYGIED